MLTGYWWIPELMDTRTFSTPFSDLRRLREIRIGAIRTGVLASFVYETALR